MKPKRKRALQTLKNYGWYPLSHSEEGVQIESDWFCTWNELYKLINCLGTRGKKFLKYYQKRRERAKIRDFFKKYGYDKTPPRYIYKENPRS